MDTEDYHRRIDQISRENANLVETVRQLRDALEDANARRLDDQAVAEARGKNMRIYEIAIRSLRFGMF